ncbi:hypothetical protein GDO81_009364 [Engystomops pustulosus]|uniref:Uncharacterized protein n=1 Tax=Engystomops pustulosus TaxID=76066 RepID=A0AAV7BR84_ENGPU|nr:hypothetical protein GDO81_009364 [Engystomops pustulosus]
MSQYKIANFSNPIPGHLAGITTHWRSQYHYPCLINCKSKCCASYGKDRDPELQPPILYEPKCTLLSPVLLFIQIEKFRGFNSTRAIYLTLSGGK